MTEIKQKIRIYSPLFLAVFIIILPLVMIKPIPFGNDLSFHLARISTLSEALNQGIFLPGVYSNYPMGYGAGLFYPDIFLSLPAILVCVGVSLINAYKFFVILIVSVSALTMAVSVESVWHSKKAGILAGVIYTLAPFHWVDLYYRASVGEMLAFIFIPFVIAGMYHLIWGDTRKWWMLAVGFSGLILSHVLTAVLTFGMSALLTAICIWRLFKDKARWICLFKAACAVFGMTAFFTLPFLEQMIRQPITGDGGYLGLLSDWAVTLKELIFALPTPLGKAGVAPPGVGMILIIIALSGFNCLQKKVMPKRYAGILTMISLILMAMCTVYFPWQLFNRVLQNLQFPWRFYFFITAFISFASGILVQKWPSVLKLAGVLCLTAVFIVNGVYIYQHYTPVTENPYPVFAGGYEYLPKALSYGEYLENCKDYEEQVTRRNYHIYEIDYHGQAVPVIYYPGYQAWLDGKPVDVYGSDTGTCMIDSQESGHLILCYKGTVIRKIGRLTTLITLIIALTIVIKKRKEKRKHVTKILSA